MNMSENKDYLKNQVIILNGFSNNEITRIMRVVKAEFESPGDLIFAKTTPNSLQMKLEELIEDMSGDHEYLKANPPVIPKKSR